MASEAARRRAKNKLKIIQCQPENKLDEPPCKGSTFEDMDDDDKNLCKLKCDDCPVMLETIPPHLLIRLRTGKRWKGCTNH